MREVTERDFRQEEFRDADPKDYEFRDDGAIVRKDRWETGVRRIASAIEFGRGDWEIKDVVAKVRKMADDLSDIENGVGDALWAELTSKEAK